MNKIFSMESDHPLFRYFTEAERDRVSSVGWAYGYAGGGLLLAINFGVVTFHDALGMSTELAVRLSMLSAGLWWAGFIIIPWLGIKRRPPVDIEQVEGGLFARAFGQLWETLKDLRNYPVALTFLVAYLFFNDGIQTVIASASIFGIEELGFAEGTVLGTYLLVQFVAMFGAIGFGRAADRFGAKRVILAGLVLGEYVAPRLEVRGETGKALASGEQPAEVGVEDVDTEAAAIERHPAIDEDPRLLVLDRHAVHADLP